MIYPFTIASLEKLYNLEYVSSTLDPQEKKKLRLEICASLPKTMLPLHACLLENNGVGIVLSGPGGCGKSTLASALEPLGYRQAAKDFIVVWEEKGKLWGGDLNFQSVNSGKKAVSIEKMVFLNKTDPRDLYRFDIHNAAKFYAESLYPQPEATSAKHSSGKIFRQLLANHFVLGNRISPEKWVKTFTHAMHSQSISRIGIIGLGTVGQDTASLIAGENWVTQLNLFTTNSAKLKAVALDLQSADPTMSIKTFYDYDSILKQSDLVCLTFRSADGDVDPNVEERMRRLSAHCSVIRNFAQSIKISCYSGIILMVTNPVDLLSYALYRASKDAFLSSQIYGVGLGLDYNRLQVVKPDKNLDVIGPHGDGLMLVKRKSDTLYPYADKETEKKVKQYSNAVRAGTDRTRFGPAHEVLNVVRHFHDQTGTIRASTLTEDGVFLGRLLDINGNIPASAVVISPDLKNSMQNIICKQLRLQNNLINNVTSKE